MKSHAPPPPHWGRQRILYIVHIAKNFLDWYQAKRERVQQKGLVNIVTTALIARLMLENVEKIEISILLSQTFLVTISSLTREIIFV